MVLCTQSITTYLIMFYNFVELFFLLFRKLLETSSSSAGKIDLPQNKTSATNNESEYSTVSQN